MSPSILFLTAFVATAPGPPPDAAKHAVAVARARTAPTLTIPAGWRIARAGKRVELRPPP